MHESVMLEHFCEYILSRGKRLHLVLSDYLQKNQKLYNSHKGGER